ncbi:hypothetical protein EDD17DRAFT_1657569 [Pisolithus thermaeus]|nr:hypothetical protein EDD17DRAFT_1657569 [Pisolithus thermaeus]
MRSCLLSTLESLLLSINIAGSQSTGTPPSLSSIRLLCTPTSRCKTCTFFFESCPTGWHCEQRLQVSWNENHICS